MIIQERKWNMCGECKCHKTVIQEEEYGCDQCKTPIAMDLDEGVRQHLEVQVFNRAHSSAEQLQFCSWKCVAEHLPKIKADYFISLPFLHYDNKIKGQRAKDFFALLKGRK